MQNTSDDKHNTGFMANSHYITIVLPELKASIEAHLASIQGQ